MTTRHLGPHPLPRLLKEDLFGRVSLHPGSAERAPEVCRSVEGAWWLRPLSRWLAHREAAALDRLTGLPGVPQLLRRSRTELVRSFLPGQPMHVAAPTDPQYFREARRLVSRLHRRGVAHNDLAKEPNWLVTESGSPALVDFQLASVSRDRGPLFRLMGREDLRHLLKHKRTYCPAALSERERRILSTPSFPARLWRATGKRAYHWITRRLLGWSDREGAGDRGAGLRTNS